MMLPNTATHKTLAIWSSGTKLILRTCVKILGKTENTATSKKTKSHSKTENIERPITQNERQQLKPWSHPEECKHCAYQGQTSNSFVTQKCLSCSQTKPPGQAAGKGHWEKPATPPSIFQTCTFLKYNEFGRTPQSPHVLRLSISWNLWQAQK